MTGFPLSAGQEGIWAFERLFPGTAVFHATALVEVHGPLAVDRLRAALDAVVERHAQLRATVATVDGEPRQAVAPDLRVALPVDDLEDADDVEDVDDRAREAARAPFDLERGPLVRARLLRLAPERHRLLVAAHHLVADGWSLGVLLRDLFERYDGAPSPPAPAPDYADFVREERTWLSGQEAADQLAYWAGRLADLPAASLPPDRPRPAAPTFATAPLHFCVPRAVAERLHRLRREEHASPVMVLLAGLHLLLRRLLGADVPVGLAVANRVGGWEDLVGTCASVVVPRPPPARTFRELVRGARERALEAYGRQRVPLETVLRRLRLPLDPGRPPLVQVALTTASLDLPRCPRTGLVLERGPLDFPAGRFDLTLRVQRMGAEIEGALDWRTEVFDPATARRLLGHLLALLASASAEPDRELAGLPVLRPDERRALVAGAAGPPAGPEPPPVHEAFAAWARRDPDRPALTFAGGALDYAGLAAEVRRLAARLRARGVGRGSVVATCLPRGPELVVSVLAVLEAGGAYLALDPAHPRPRLELLLADAGARLLLTPADADERLAGLPAERCAVELGSGTAEAAPEAGPRAGPGDLAYVVYTSGSTGRPKGVEVEHRALAHLIAAFGAGMAGERMLQVTSPAFDVFALEVFSALATGARLDLLSDADAASPAAVAAAFEAHATTAIATTPALLGLLPAPDAGPAPATVVVGGEALPWELAERWAEGRRLLNVYGPTEATVLVTAHEVAPGERSRRPTAFAPIGRPIPGCRVHVLGPDLEPVPPGAVGQLCIGGPTVARGYRGRPDLTAASFAPDPHAGEAGARLYLTGDLGRRLADGELEFVGRLDDQVKVRGFRVEPGEARAALLGHPAVRDAAVVAVPGAGLVAHVAAAEPVAAGELRRFLLERLPRHLVPDGFSLYDRLPLTATGKVDTRALRAPAAAAPAEPAAPTSDLEARLAAILGDVLGVDAVGVETPFFDLGATSLHLVRAHDRIVREVGPGLRLVDLLEHQDVRALARAIAGRPAPAEPGAAAAGRRRGREDRLERRLRARGRG